MNDIITKEVTLTSDIDTIWKAISVGEEISKWFLTADFNPTKGYKYTFKSPEGDCDPIVGEVLNATPYTLIYTWIIKGTDTVTTVEWNLEKLPNGTKLRLTHSGIANYGNDSAIKMYESFNGGWDNCINLLSTHLS